ncbi:protein sidekick-1-like protein [Cricetulus griseus]|nr:protein sidekick-1-like protein [Cricetulus griseus]
MTGITVSGLTPARTYQFRVCAVNQVGKGQYSTETSRYRLAGLPGEHQQRNISSPEVNYCLVTDLIIWTQYEIQVAAYNGAGLGVFSRAVTEYTLQGVDLVLCCD